MRVTFSAPTVLGAMVMVVAVGGRAEAGAVQQPNLRVVNITPSDTAPTVGDMISIAVKIQNGGPADAGSFDVDLFYNRASPPAVGERGDEWKTVASLAGQSTTTVVFTGITSLVEELWGVYAIVDTNDDVVEKLETDNVSVRRNLSWEYPDLVVQEIVPSNASPNAGDTISVSVSVGNVGTRATGSFTVDLFYDRGSPPSLGETGDQTITVSSLAAAGSTVVNFAGITSASPGTWNMYAIVNTDGAVLESDTSNNVFGPVQVVWGSAGTAPDLTITAITPSTPAYAGSTITVDVTIENLGDAASGTSRIDLFYDRGTPPAFGDTGDQNKNLSNLGVGASTTLTFIGVTNAVPADWSMYAIVDTLEGVTESDETNNIAGPAAVQWQGVDLLITGITPSDASPLAGGTISVDVTVQNQGNIAAGAFDVGLFYDEVTAPNPGDAADQTQNVASLGVGASTTLTFNGVTSASAGTWSTYAVADNALPASDLDEYDETNNVSGPVSVTWRAPDLVITSITPSNASPTAGGTIDVDVVVTNLGSADAGAFDVDLFFNEAVAPFPGAVADLSQNVPGLNAGQQVVLAFLGITNAIAETWSVYAIADNGTAVAESNEANNVGGPVEVIWGGLGTIPDLIILSIVPSDSDPAIGMAISVDVTVGNQGDADAGALNIGLFHDEAAAPSPGDVADQTENVSSLAQSAQTVVTFTGITSTTPGAWSMYAVADNGLGIAESDEANNVSIAAAVTWHAPELVIVSIVPSDTDPDVGSIISVDVTVTNSGDAPAGAFDVGLFYNEGTAPAAGDTADQSQNVASLGIGASSVLTFTGITSSASGAWSMFAAADNGLAVAESDESNNVAGPQTVTWHGPDLVMSAITPSDNTPATSDTITVDVTVMNLGDRDAGAFDVALFYNRATLPSVGDASDQTQNVVSLGVGGLTVVTFTGITNTVEEVWKTWAAADNASAVTEGDETNNVGGPATITWGAPLVPDLVVVSIVPSDVSPNTGDTITVDVTVVNNGTSDASLFDVGLFYNLAAAPGPGDPADQTKGVGTLASGAQKTLTFTSVTNITAEVWLIYALVDSGDVVIENNEANNTAGPVEVNWGAVAGITVLVPNGGEVWEVGTTRQITWDSYGDIGSTDVMIEFTTDDGASWGTIVASTLDDGLYDWTVPDAVSALCTVRVTAAAGASPPADVSDANFAIVPAVAGRADLSVVSLSPSLSYAMPGTDISVDLTVRNFGTAQADNFFLTLFYDRSTPPAATDPGNKSVLIEQLASGSEVTISFANITSIEFGTWHMYAYVDPGPGDGSVEESNETNNVFGPVLVGWGENVGVVRVVRPNGGESFERGFTYTVEWEEPRADVGASFNIEISTDGGATWTEIARDVPEGADHTYLWYVDAPASAACRLRISDSAGTVSDVSDRAFSVVAEGTGALPLIGQGCAATAARFGFGFGSLLVLAAAMIALRALGRTAARAL